MGKAKWWVCDDCKSLNDLPANKCYNCRSEKPASPTLMDDQYGQVGGATEKRVAITVDLDEVGDLTAPDPLEQAEGGGIIEAFNFDESQPVGSNQGVEPLTPPPPLREPTSTAPLPTIRWRLASGNSTPERRLPQASGNRARSGSPWPCCRGVSPAGCGYRQSDPEWYPTG